MEEEIWRPVIGYENLYEVSDLGRVRSMARDIIKCRGALYHLPQRVLKPQMYRSGYLFVALCKDGKPKNFYIHRLVAQAFIANPKGLLEVNHIDEDKQNNAVSNLEWCDRVYNINYGTGISRRAAAQTNGKCSKPVQQLTKDGTLVALWPSTHEAERATGVKQQNICKCCNGRPHFCTAGGFIWRYAE